MLALQLPARNSSVDFREHGYIMEEFVGKGQFGRTYKVRYETDGSIWLAKSIDLASLDEKDKLLSLQEAAVMQTLDHPGIVGWRESFVHHDMFLVIIMEFCEQGDLLIKMDELRDSGDSFPEDTVIRIATQLSEALRYIHSRNILHRDIKPSNIFLTESGDVKIGDFGISRLMTTSLAMASTAVGTPQYMSPEMCESKPYTYKSDVWALGCVVYEAAALRNAFEADSFLALVLAIASKPPNRLPTHYSQDLQHLVDWLLAKDPEERPSAVQILSLPFIQKHRLLAAYDATTNEFNSIESTPNSITTNRFDSVDKTGEPEETEDWASRQLPADHAVTAAVGGGGRAIRRRSLGLVPPTRKARSNSNAFRPQQFQIVTGRIKLALDEGQHEDFEMSNERELEDGEILDDANHGRRDSFLGFSLSETLTIEILQSIVYQTNAHVSMNELEFVLDRLTLGADNSYITVGDFVRALDPLVWGDVYETTLEWTSEALALDQMSPSERRGGYSLEKAFRQFDGRDSGSVTRSAFRAVFHIFFPHLANGDLEDLYNFAPKTTDGQVLYEAFLHESLQLPHAESSPNTSLSSPRRQTGPSFRPGAHNDDDEQLDRAPTASSDSDMDTVKPNSTKRLKCGSSYPTSTVTTDDDESREHSFSRSTSEEQQQQQHYINVMMDGSTRLSNENDKQKHSLIAQSSFQDESDLKQNKQQSSDRLAAVVGAGRSPSGGISNRSLSNRPRSNSGAATSVQPLTYKTRLSYIAAASSSVASPQMIHCQQSPRQLPSTFGEFKRPPCNSPSSYDQPLHQQRHQHPRSSLSISPSSSYMMDDDDMQHPHYFPTQSPLHRHRRSSLPTSSPRWMESTPNNAVRSTTPPGGRSALAAFGSPQLFPSSQYPKQRVASSSSSMAIISKQSPIREYQHPIMMLQNKTYHDDNQHSNDNGIKNELEWKKKNGDEHQCDLSDRSTAAATSNSLGSNSTMLELLHSPDTSMSSSITGHSTMASPSPQLKHYQRMSNFPLYFNSDHNNRNIRVEPFPPISIQLTHGEISHTLFSSSNQSDTDANMPSAESDLMRAPHLYGFSVSHTAIRFPSHQRDDDISSSQHFASLSPQQSHVARILPFASHTRSELLLPDFESTGNLTCSHHATSQLLLRPNANRSHHRTAVEGRVEAATSMQFLLHHLQAERAASCRAAATAVQMNVESTQQNREKALSRLLEHRTRTDDAAASARRTVTLSFHAQRALLDRVSAKEGSLFTNIIHEGCLLLNTLVTTIASHRSMVDQLCKRRRRNDSHDDDDDSSGGDSPWSAASSIYPSDDEVVSVGGSEDFDEDAMADILSVWSSRFLFVTEQLTTDISRLLAWLMHLVSALKNSPYNTFQKVNQLKELLSSQLAFIAARQPNEHLKADWDAARFFMGLVVARKSVAASMRLESEKDNSKHIAKEFNVHQQLTDLEAKLLHNNADSETITSWRKSAMSCLAKLQLSAVRHLNDLQFDLQLDLDHYNSQNHHNTGNDASLFGASPRSSVVGSTRNSKRLLQNGGQNNRQSSHRHRRRLSLPDVLRSATHLPSTSHNDSFIESHLPV